MTATNVTVGLIAFIFGMIAGIALLVGVQVRAVQRFSASQPLKSNTELLGEVTTVADRDDPLAAELRADDVKNGRLDK